MNKHKPLIISLQQNTDIGYIPINTPSSHDFIIENKNEFPVSYKWKYTIFQVEPNTGILLPNSINKFKIIFKVQEAVVVVGTILLQSNYEEPRVFKLSVIGKYSNLGCTRQPVEFSPTTVGKISSKKIIIKNSSVVPSVFTIKNQRTANFKDNPFSVTPNRGQIPPKSSFQLNIKYAPIIPDTTYNTHFTVQSESGTNIDISCHAKSISFEVSLSPKSINFGQVKLQSSTTRAVTLYNNSDRETDYQFFCQVGNIFSIVQNKGTIPSNSFKKVIVQFDPKNTLCYYERIYCIIRNHKLLYIDLMGTCYDLLIKPLPIVQIHVDLFRRRVIEGRLSEIDFKYLQNNLQMKINKKLELLKEDKNLTNLEQFDIPQINFNQTEVSLHKQLFLQSSQNQLLTLSTDFIDFGHCDTMTISSQQELIVTNNLPCKITIYWILQKRENFNGDFMTAFQIFPESATIKPGANVKFNVSFRPLKSQYFFFQHLQFFALKEGGKITKKTLEDFEKKQLRSLRPETTLLKTLKVTQTIQSKVTAQLSTAQLMPSLSGIVRCVGHSFGIPSSAYIPIMSIYPSKNIIFSPCKVGQFNYQTVQLINNSDTPTYFKTSHDINRIFRIFPKCGLIEGKSFQILTLQFAPKNYKVYSTTIAIHLNGFNGNPLQLNLHGQCPEPQLKIPQNKLFFSKCFLGVYSKQNFYIQNMSRLPINFKAQIPEKYQQQIFLNFKQKKLQSNETLQIEACFIPQYKKQYRIRIPIKITEEKTQPVIGYYLPGSGVQSSIITPQPKQQEYFIEVFGQGGDGSLALQKEEIDFGVVKVLEQKKLQVKLCNLSDCTFYIQLSLKSKNKQINSHDIQSTFSLDFVEGTLVAKAQTLIGITFSPLDVKDFDVLLTVSARQKLPKSLKLTSKNLNTAKCSLQIKAQGSYPLLQMVDVRNDCLSVTTLWQSFQLSKINHTMSTNLSVDEKKYLQIETLPFVQTQALQQKLHSFDWNFGYISSRNASKPRKVLLTVKNFGGIDLDYNFKFPFDNAIQKQIWADPGEPTKEEAYQKAIISKNIFQIKPKSDKLKPGEVKDIQLIYTPVSINGNKNSKQQHFLRVVLEIKNGKAMVLNLRGMILGPQQGLLVVKKTTYVLPDTPIGMINALKFPIELQNVGSIKIFYKSVVKYNTGEFQEVFWIQNPEGVLSYSEKDYLFCMFKPLQKKQYRFKIVIFVQNTQKIKTQTLEIQIIGKGSDKTTPAPLPIKNIQQIPGQRTLVSQIGSKVFFSIQEIDFGIVKSLSSTYRMVIIYNLSANDPLSFDFPISNLSDSKNNFTCGDKFLIQPSSGQIPPNDFMELKITLVSGQTPSSYEGQMECQVFWNNRNASDTKASMFDKQSLFLRIKKLSEMSSINNNIVPEFKEQSTIFHNIFSNLIQSTLTNTYLLQSFQQIQELPVGVVDLIVQDPSINIQYATSDIEQIKNPRRSLDHSNYQTMFVNDEFLNTGDIILQNTFFNIIQQTTHKENDLLRVTKKFIPTTQQQ